MPRAKLGRMTTREKAHKLLDELPEDELEPVKRFCGRENKDRFTEVKERDRGCLKEATQPSWVVTLAFVLAGRLRA